MNTLKILLFLSLAATLPAEDFTAIRKEFSGAPGFNPSWQADEARKRIADLWEEGKIDEGMALAKAWLEKVPVDIRMHGWYSHFLETKGDFAGSFRHHHFKFGLLHSITSTGTGLSPDSPWEVISAHEEYDVLANIGAELIDQTLGKTSDGKPCDVMRCRIGGNEVTFYFDISVPMSAIGRLLTPGG